MDLSVDMRESRSDLIVDIVESWRSRYRDQIRLMIFTKGVIHAAGLEKVEDLAIVIPRPLEVDMRHLATFHDSEGVLLSSYAELCDNKLMSEPVEMWIDAIRAALPSTSLYAMGDHGSRLTKDFGVEIIADVEDPVAGGLVKARLMISPLRHHPFEAIPMEAAAVGIPVVYRKAEQSLSGYLGTGGVEISSPGDLGEILPLLYDDPSVWRARGIAGMQRARSVDYRATRGELYAVLSQLVR